MPITFSSVLPNLVRVLDALAEHLNDPRISDDLVIAARELAQLAEADAGYQTENAVPPEPAAPVRNPLFEG